MKDDVKLIQILWISKIVREKGVIPMAVVMVTYRPVPYSPSVLSPLYYTAWISRNNCRIWERDLHRAVTYIPTTALTAGVAEPMLEVTDFCQII